MRTFFGSLLLLLLCVCAARAQDFHVRGEHRDIHSNSDLGFRGIRTVIHQGGLYWVSSGRTHRIRGNFLIHGEARVTNTDFLSTPAYMTSRYARARTNNVWDGNTTITSTGRFVVYDAYARNGARFPWTVSSVDNEGMMQWCWSGVAGTPKGVHRVVGTWHNKDTGIQYYGQTSARAGTYTWRSSSVNTLGYSTSNLINDGSMVLNNISNFRVLQNVYGNGCWVVEQNARLDIENARNQNGGVASAWEGQSVYLQTPTSGIYFPLAAYNFNSTIGLRLYGWGNSNYIAFNAQPRAFYYDSGAGKLTWVVGSTTGVLTIGKGYNPSFMKIIRLPSGVIARRYALIYAHPTPEEDQDLPSKCQVPTLSCNTYERSEEWEPCYRDSDCEDGETCVDNSCGIPPCSSNNECDEDEMCVDGNCEPIDSDDD